MRKRALKWVRQGEGSERQRERENIGQALCWVWSQRWGLLLMIHEIMTWAETASQTLNWLSHTGAPKNYFWIKDGKKDFQRHLKFLQRNNFSYILILFSIIPIITSISTRKEAKDSNRETRTRNIKRELDVIFQMTNFSWKSELLATGIITKLKRRKMEGSAIIRDI